MEFVNFRSLVKSSSIDLLFRGWEKGEKVAFLSPHDDDIILGAGYLLSAVLKNKGTPLIFIFCSGDAGYSSPEEKDSIVKKRKTETLRAYGSLGVQEEHIFFFDIPDFSLMAYVNRTLPYGPGLFESQVRLFREKKVSRAVFASGHYENRDHTAVYDMGMYTAPQSGDPILADLGKPSSIRSYLIYSVWCDFEPPKETHKDIRADLGILAADTEEEKIREAIQQFSSQKQIIKHIVSHREKRKSDTGYLELYQSAVIRKQIDFQKYFSILGECKKESE